MNNTSFIYENCICEEDIGRMVDERKYTKSYRKPLVLDIGNWDEYVQIFEEMQSKDPLRVSKNGILTKYVVESHIRDLTGKAEKIRAKWRASHADVSHM